MQRKSTHSHARRALLINIAKEIKKSREQAHHDAVTLAEVLSEAIGNSSEEA